MNTIINFDGNVALVTGASSGIGFSIAQYLLENHCFVYLLSKDPEKLNSSFQSLSKISQNIDKICCDLTDSLALKEIPDIIRKKHGTLNFLINNAGISLRKMPHEMSELDWDAVVDLNLKSVFSLCKEVYPLMKGREKVAKIVNIGSMSSIFGAGLACAYSASKGGLVQLTKSLACAWAGENILINCVLPGWVQTDLTLTGRRDHPEFYKKIDQAIPLQRWAQPSDIGKIVTLLLSEYNGYMTGSTICVDGGFSCSIV